MQWLSVSNILSKLKEEKNKRKEGRKLKITNRNEKNAFFFEKIKMSFAYFPSIILITMQNAKIIPLILEHYLKNN